MLHWQITLIMIDIKSKKSPVDSDKIHNKQTGRQGLPPFCALLANLCVSNYKGHQTKKLKTRQSNLII